MRTDRLRAVSALVVGVAVTVVGLSEYVAGLETPEPFASGVLVCGAGLALVCGGWLSLSADETPFPLVVATGVGLGTLAVAVLSPASLLFGGVFWLALVAFALVAAGVYPAVAAAVRRRRGR